ncbi:hypothetical protein [Bradyrhizobium sp. BWC-3-1]|uniref:hypothetical protein n=1 Tax=Bradyrhizobium sp. BWC-3-1 TaxID=3080012 RepID=UPI00293E43E2|nr:hypothetical protein [Bradyrhizobium sp. BWC-3-1]WOH57637.1 hypothetical protein RX329_36590 [Bradyrhizobium sp. BWC-3-1]
MKDKEPSFFTRQMDAPAAMHEMLIDRSRVVGYSDALVANLTRTAIMLGLTSPVTMVFPTGNRDRDEIHHGSSNRKIQGENTGN